MQTLLNRTPLCQDLSPEEVARIAQLGRFETHPAHTLLVEAGHPAPGLIILLSGHVAILKHDPHGEAHQIAILGSGAVVGEMSLLLSTTPGEQVKTVEDVQLFILERDTFDELLQARDPSALLLTLAIARVLAGRLRDQNARVVGLLESLENQESHQQARKDLEWRWEY